MVEFLGWWMAERWLAEGWLVLTGVSWVLAGDWPGEGLAAGTPRVESPRSGEGDPLFGQPRKHQFHIETVTITTE